MLRKMFGRKKEQQSGSGPEEALRPLKLDSPPPPEKVAAEERLAVEWSPSGSVKTNRDGDLLLRVSDVKQARLAIKELRSRKRALNAEKRRANQTMTAIRQQFSTKNVRRSPAVRGMGGFGRTLRTMDQLSRANDRSNRENQLAPYAAEKQQLELGIHHIDQLIHHCEVYILENEASENA